MPLVKEEEVQSSVIADSFLKIAHAWLFAIWLPPPV